MQRSSEINHASSVSSPDVDQLEPMEQIEDAARQCYDPFPSISVQVISAEDFLKKSYGKTVLSDQLSSGFVSERALALHADIADTREDYHIMTVIVSAQFPTRCGHSPVTHTDSESDSDSDSSDSVFYTIRPTETTKKSSSDNPTSCPLPIGTFLSLFGSSKMTTETNTSVTEADFDVEDNTTKVKADVGEDSKASDATNKDVAEDSKASDANKDVTDDTKASDATNKDQVGDKSTDKNIVQVADKASDKDAASVKNQADDAKAGDDQEDQSWGNWNKWTWNKKQEGQQLSHNAKKKLNKEMRELVRPVHVGSLAYVLPDKAKKCCLTWRNAVEHHLSSTGKPPAWSEFFLECKICHRFHRTEKDFEDHYASKHSDESVYRQCLRRLKQWNTKDVSASEVEANVELIYSVGQAINIENKQIEADILAASGKT